MGYVKSLEGIALLVTLFSLLLTFDDFWCVSDGFMSFTGPPKKDESQICEITLTDKLIGFEHTTPEILFTWEPDSQLELEEEMTKTDSWGTSGFFPSNHGGFMNDLFWVCGEKTLMFFFVGIFSWRTCKFQSNLEQTWGWSPQLVGFVLFNGETRSQTCRFYREYGF